MPQVVPRSHGEPRPVSEPSSDNASAKPMLMPAPIEAARPTRNVCQFWWVAKAAANNGASVETEPSINPARPGWTYCSTNMRRRVLSSSARTSGLRICVGQLDREFLVALFLLGEIAEQAAHADILGLLGGLDVEALGLQLHGLDFLADGVERQVFGQPDRPAA